MSFLSYEVSQNMLNLLRVYALDRSTAIKGSGILGAKK